MEETANNGKVKIPMFVLLGMVVILALCLTAIFWAVQIFYSSPEDQGAQTWAGWLLLGGVLALAVATYALFQIRRKMSSLRIEIPPITTTVECRKCGFKNVRAFQRGDYIFKEGERCQKCNNNTLITAIYREIKDKEKQKF